MRRRRFFALFAGLPFLGRLANPRIEAKPIKRTPIDGHVWARNYLAQAKAAPELANDELSWLANKIVNLRTGAA